MDQIIDSYEKCQHSCYNNPAKTPSCVCKYVCQDRFRQDLGDYAQKYGNNNSWPFQNANFTPTKKYIAVEDMDKSFRVPLQNNPFAIPLRQVTGGCVGANN